MAKLGSVLRSNKQSPVDAGALFGLKHAKSYKFDSNAELPAKDWDEATQTVYRMGGGGGSTDRITSYGRDEGCPGPVCYKNDID